VITAAASAAWLIIYFSVVFPYIPTIIPQGALTTFNFKENEWFDAPNVRIIDRFRPSGPGIANDELFYEINYTNKQGYSISIEPTLEIQFGGRITNTLTDIPTTIPPDGSGQHKIRFFSSNIGENQVIFSANVLNTTDGLSLGMVTTTINIDIHSQESATLKEQNVIAQNGVLISVAVGTVTAAVLVLSLSPDARLTNCGSKIHSWKRDSIGKD
jgi:hypothetical protein